MSCHRKSHSPSASDVEKRQIANTLHSKTRSLPNETVSYIFQHACPKLDIFDKLFFPDSRFHLVLRLVSTVWYSVVQSTPQLWNSLYMFNITREGKKEYIKLCLDWSGRLGLHIYFYPLPLPDYLPHIQHANEDWVNKIMERNVHRIESLKTSNPTPEWFANIIPKMLNLKAINIYDAPDLPKGPSLKWMRLKIAKLDGLYKEPPMTSITYLDLRWIPIDFSIVFLIGCPNLVEFSCHDHFPRETSDTSVCLSTLVLDRLSTFSWSIPAQSSIQLHDQLFECLHVPALQRFCLSNNKERQLDTNTATFTFLSRLPKSMKELEFRCIDDINKEGILRNVVNDAGISRIRVALCSPPFLTEIFSTLSETTNEGTFRFPNLTCIEVGHPKLGLHDPPFRSWVGWELALMLQNRTGTTDRFTFTSHNNRLREWDDKIWVLFKELKEDGLNLTIIESGNVVDIEAKYEELLEGWTSDSD